MKLVWIALAIVVVGRPSSAQGPEVTVNEGTLRGKTVPFSANSFINKTVDVDMYLGIPYAAPPVRFAAPTSMLAWEGIRNATEFTAVCQQRVSTRNPPPEKTSEDCLYLNVYTPSPKPSGIPVMVWIHGGTAGMSAMSYDVYGVPLVAVGDVIIVTINYRLNIFSFFSTAFGGNRENITIFGQSAGAASVGLHHFSKLSRPYFSQAIMQSGTAFAMWAFTDNPEREREKSTELGVAMGCDVTNSTVMVQCLREKDAEELRIMSEEVYDGDVFVVTMDGTFLEDSPENLYRSGDFARVPTMLGFNKDEGTLVPYNMLPEYIGTSTPPYYDRATYLANIQGLLASFGMGDEIVLDSVDQEYTDWTVADDPDADYFDPLVNVFGDLRFNCPMDDNARSNFAQDTPVYKFYMTHPPTNYYDYEGVVPNTPWLGATHGEELTFIWGIPFIDELYNIKGHNMTDEENALSVKFMEFWTNFAKSGDPSKASVDADPGVGENYWPEYTIPELYYKELAPGLPVGRALLARQCNFWNEYIPELTALTNDIDDLEQEWRENYDDWKTEMTDWQTAFEEYKDGNTCN